MPALKAHIAAFEVAAAHWKTRSRATARSPNRNWLLSGVPAKVGIA
jgi:hypothetical protein